MSQGKQSRWGGSEGAGGGSKGFHCRAATLWFHFNRLSPEPFLTDKGNENKSLSSAQRDGERSRWWYPCVCVYRTLGSTEERRGAPHLSSLDVNCASALPPPNFWKEVGVAGGLHSLATQVPRPTPSAGSYPALPKAKAWSGPPNTSLNRRASSAFSWLLCLSSSTLVVPSPTRSLSHDSLLDSLWHPWCPFHASKGLPFSAAVWAHPSVP